MFYSLFPGVSISDRLSVVVSCVPIPVDLVFYCVKPEPHIRLEEVGQGNTI